MATVEQSQYWTPERVELLRQCWAVDGMTGTECGKRIGCSKSAAIGQAHKQGFKQGRSAEQRIKDKQQAAQMNGHRHAVDRPVLPPPPPAPRVCLPWKGKGILFINARADMCRFPLWEYPDKTGKVCGRKI